jgi:hypothetical protein
MLQMGLDLRLMSHDHTKLAYAATMAPVMEFLMQAEDGDAVAGAVRLHNSSTAQHELADISGIPVDVRNTPKPPTNHLSKPALQYQHIAGPDSHPPLMLGLADHPLCGANGR